MVTKPDKLFFSFTNDDKVYIIGSRKVTQVDVSAEFEGYDITSLYGTSVSGCIPSIPSYNLTGNMRGFIQVVGNSFEEAMFNLLLAFREEEQEEQRQALLAAERAAEYASRREALTDDDIDYYDNYYDGDDDYDDYDYDDDCDCYWCQR